MDNREMPLNAAENPVRENKPAALAQLQPGETAFAVLLFLVGAGAFGQSLKLWLSTGQPRIASAAALPLFASTVWAVFSLIIILENIRKSRPLSRRHNFAALKQALNYAFPTSITVVLLAIMAYCICLLLHISFYIVTPLFLWGSMCFLRRGGYVKNLIWTAICMVFIILVFRLLFGVVLP